MAKSKVIPSLLFYQLQPLELDENLTDYRLHLRADTDQGIKALKRWLHKFVYRKAYYYDRVAEYYTIKKNGRYFLGLLERNPTFQTCEGIP